MRLFVGLVLIFSNSYLWAKPTSSAVYACDFTDTNANHDTIRMKKYFDPSSGVDLGKVDLLIDSAVFESSPTKIYQIPIWEKKTYFQIWYATDLRVDAHLSLTGNNRTFSAVYNKGPLRRPLFCTTLSM
ncbi:MAG: cell wall hydrolase [Bdellovibrionaceae bacterium]|nr:cell wall hydrolase [Pseudobdellovibrionaceae bacterium]